MKGHVRLTTTDLGRVGGKAEEMIRGTKRREGDARRSIKSRGGSQQDQGVGRACHEARRAEEGGEQCSAVRYSTVQYSAVQDCR
jgi:hypothetical protein